MSSLSLSSYFARACTLRSVFQTRRLATTACPDRPNSHTDQNAYRRWRYANDTECREKCLQHNRDSNVRTNRAAQRRLRYAEDSGYRERCLQHKRASYVLTDRAAYLRRRYAKDSEYRERILRYSASPEYLQKRRQRYANDPEVQRRHNERYRTTRSRGKEEPSDERVDSVSRLGSWRTWVLRNYEKLSLEWTDHKILFEKDSKEHYCSGCGKFLSRKLWWKRKQSNAFDCTACFTSDRTRAIPKGHEDRNFAGGSRGRSKKKAASARPTKKAASARPPSSGAGE